MPAHETKVCEICGTNFECKVGNVTECQCFGVKLNPEEQLFIKNKYNDCLCANCMQAVKSKYHAGKQVDKMNAVIGNERFNKK